MEYSVKSGTPEKQHSGCLVVGIYSGNRLSEAAQQLDAATGGAIKQVLRRGDHSGRLGQTLLLHNLPNAPSERVLLVGCGKEKEFNEARYREATAAAVGALKNTGAVEVTSYLTELEVRGRDMFWKLRHAVDVTEAAFYRFDRLKSKNDNGDNGRRGPKRMVLAVPKRSDLQPGEQAIREALAIASGARFARDLGNLPPNICTPTYLAEQAIALAEQYGLRSTVLDEPQMRELGMGALLAVARGSHQPPKLIALEYRGAAETDAPVVLVGKGVTFDTGGISIKPAANMDEMKYDMCGAAAVLAAVKVAAELKLPLNVVAVVPATENMPGGQATRPGDIVTSMSGQTIEILNTDAEGRLILCDALTYAGRYKPAVVIDVATLTGACVVALGSPASGLLANNDQLARELLNAGKYAWDRAWQLPLWDDYQKQIDGSFADVANVGSGREAGTIIGACFLSRFTRDYKWAHLDIAGTAWRGGKEKGATGRPVPLLAQYLIDRARKGAAPAE